ncbi:hypothetical protein A2Z67_00010 [Candidatus Woesebacteria bacterium RBG_13_36_22]|uniref:Uncharacterized protein n=1 Tax=Candidatus Woesebacteria bacterium RBG_13_36_22 TaxID=1802478 RepID=A0A1F7X6A8_9BACT|nr:MAG: hypothetical protein A2Z67_00010 [Candidatus Woesebacteria bacterium RBG_13_36_22]
MLSNHEFIKAIENSIYPKAAKIENECLQLFNKQFLPGRGPTGLTGRDELAWTIGLLKSSVSFLERLAKEQKIEI